MPFDSWMLPGTMLFFAPTRTRQQLSVVGVSRTSLPSLRTCASYLPRWGAAIRFVDKMLMIHGIVSNTVFGARRCLRAASRSRYLASLVVCCGVLSGLVFSACCVVWVWLSLVCQALLHACFSYPCSVVASARRVLRGLFCVPLSLLGRYNSSVLVGDTPEVIPHGVHQVGPAPATCLGMPSTFSIDPKHKLKVESQDMNARCRPTRSVAHPMGPVGAGCWPLANCEHNALNALVNRHAVVQPRCRRLHLPRRLVHFVAGMYAETALLIPKWMSKWSAAKQKVIKESIRLQPAVPDRVKPFVKREVNHKPPTKARLIQGYMTPSTQAVFGPELYAFQKSLGFLVDFEIFPGIFITVGSGRNAKFLAEWPGMCPFDCAVYYERDGKNWDATMSAEHHRVKIELMRSCAPPMAEFVDTCFRVKAIYRNAKTRAVAFRYTLNGTVKSGHNDTTSGNTIVNLIIVSNAMRDLGFRGRCIATGDDLLVQLDPSSCAARSDLSQVCSALLKREAMYGIKPEGRCFHDIEDSTFVSGRWVRDGVVHRFLPLMGRLVARLWWTVKPPSSAKRAAYLHGVATAIRSVSQGCLVADGLTSWVPATSAKYDMKGLDSSWAFLGEQTLRKEAVNQALVRIYGLPSSVLSEANDQLHRVGKCGPARVSNLALGWMMQHDLCDIADRPSTHAPN